MKAIEAAVREEHDRMVKWANELSQERCAWEREVICQLIADNDHMGTTELIETIRKEKANA